MADVLAGTKTRQLMQKYLVDSGLAEELSEARAEAARHPAVAQQIYDLIRRLPDTPEAERGAIVRQVEQIGRASCRERV